MHYVKQFNINGVNTKQVACIELQGVPNAATEGAVGVLGIDVTSPTHEVYRCVEVKGSVYTWELLSGGLSIISATITGEGGITKEFPYENLLIPNGYLIKQGDLIFDSEAYLYRIESIGADSCNASYTGTHIGGIASGDKDYSLVIKNGMLQLVTESGNVRSSLEYSLSDNDTIYRDSSTGKITAIGIRTISGSVLRFFVGTQQEYDKLTDAQKKGLFAIISDDESKSKLEEAIKGVADELVKLESYLDGKITDLKDAIESGNIIVEQANYAGRATALKEGWIFIGEVGASYTNKTVSLQDGTYLIRWRDTKKCEYSGVISIDSENGCSNCLVWRDTSGSTHIIHLSKTTIGSYSDYQYNEISETYQFVNPYKITNIQIKPLVSD